MHLCRDSHGLKQDALYKLRLILKTLVWSVGRCYGFADSSALSVGEQIICNWLHLRLANRRTFPLAYGLCDLSEPIAQEFRDRLISNDYTLIPSDYPLRAQAIYELNYFIQAAIMARQLQAIHEYHPRVLKTRTKKCGRTANCSCTACQRLANL